MNNNSTALLKLALTLGIIALTLSVLSLFQRPSKDVDGTINHVAGLLSRIDKTSEMHVGYGVYPPYTQENPNTKQVSGFSIEIIEHIAKELKCKVVWHRLNWNTMSADLKRGEFDVIADPIFQTIPRAREFAFTAPYAYFADGIALVRKDDNRFTDFASLDQEGITITVGQGWASETLIRTRFTKPKIVSVQTATDLLQVFNEVVGGRADVAIADGASVQRFAEEHQNTVKVLWLDAPPAFMSAGFALKPSDASGAEFLTVCLRNLDSTGVLDALARKHGVVVSPKTKTDKIIKD